MWDFVKITGEVEGNRIRVKLPTGEELLAPVLTSLGVPVPSEKWITDNKDKFLAIMGYKDGLNPYPIILGFYPVRGANSESFSIFERLLQINLDLLGLLASAKVTTQLGPQPFMADTQKNIEDIKTKLQELVDNIYTVKL
jgi:hypothetical protein